MNEKKQEDLSSDSKLVNDHVYTALNDGLMVLNEKAISKEIAKKNPYNVNDGSLVKSVTKK